MLRGTEKATGMEGVTVFGSAVLRVPPDMAAVVVAVTRVEKKPDAAFSQAREAARAVTAYLQRAGVQDFGSSRATLANEFQGVGNDRRFVGYQAMIEFSLIVRDLDRVDALIAEVLAAGANVLRSVTFQTSRLKELRAEARRRAVLGGSGEGGSLLRGGRGDGRRSRCYRGREPGAAFGSVGRAHLPRAGAGGWR